MRLRLQLFICLMVFGGIAGESLVGAQDRVPAGSRKVYIAAPQFRVKVSYDGYDGLQQQVLSYMTQGLNESGYVEVVDENPDFQVDIYTFVLLLDGIPYISISSVYLDFWLQKAVTQELGGAAVTMDKKLKMHGLNMGWMVHHTIRLAKLHTLESTVSQIVAHFNLTVLKRYRQDPARNILEELKEQRKFTITSGKPGIYSSSSVATSETVVTSGRVKPINMAEQIKKWLMERKYQIKKVTSGYRITRNDSRNENRYRYDTELANTGVIAYDEVIFTSNGDGTISVGIEGVGTATFEVDRYGNLRVVADE